jgi:hypothetical protein
MILALLTLTAAFNLAHGPRVRAAAAPVTASGCGARR